MSKIEELREIGEYDSLTFCQKFIRELLTENYKQSQLIRRYREITGTTDKDCTTLVDLELLRAELVAANENRIFTADENSRLRAALSRMNEDYTDVCNKNVALKIELTALKAEIERLREANRWIPVGERLPSGDCDPVYRYEDEHVWTEDYFCRIEFDGTIVFDAAVFDVNRAKWFRVDYDGTPIELNVTHWTLLPAPIERQTQ